MSPKANIIVINPKENGEHYVQLYHHTNGDFHGVGTELLQYIIDFFDYENKEQIFTDAITFAKELNKKDSAYIYEFDTPSHSEIHLHTDIEYFYVIDLNENSQRVCYFEFRPSNEKNNTKEWKLKPFLNIINEAAFMFTNQFGTTPKQLEAFMSFALKK